MSILKEKFNISLNVKISELMILLYYNHCKQLVQLYTHTKILQQKVEVCHAATKHHYGFL